MKRYHREKTTEITRAVLQFIAVAGFVTLVGLFANGKNADKLVKGLGALGVNRVRATLRRLKLQSMIEFDEHDEHAPIVLTAKGMKRVMNWRFFDVLADPPRWDHFWRMVLFDIPERTGKRRAFQYALGRVGFYRLQKSVYVVPFDVKKEVLEYARFNGIFTRIVFVTTASLGSYERDARGHFFRKAQCGT